MAERQKSTPGSKDRCSSFYDWFGLENIEKEARITRAVHASGLPVPAVGEIVCVNNRYGLVYERVNGISMLEVW